MGVGCLVVFFCIGWYRRGIVGGREKSMRKIGERREKGAGRFVVVSCCSVAVLQFIL